MQELIDDSRSKDVSRDGSVNLGESKDGIEDIIPAAILNDSREFA